MNDLAINSQRRAVFLDRDGVLNVDFGYVSEISKLVLCEGVISGLQSLMKSQYLLFVITNQSGIARGYYSESAAIQIHEYMGDVFAGHGIRIDGWYYCPHHAKGSVEPYAIECTCRKPKTGLIDRACQDFLGISREQSWLIGDKRADIKCGLAANLRTIQIRGNYPIHEKAEYCVNSFGEAVEIILNHRFDHETS